MRARSCDRNEVTRKMDGPIFGVLLIAIGSYAWITEAQMTEILRLWPLLLIAVGVSKLIADRSRRDGAVLLGIGVLFLLDHLDILSLWNSWPLLLIVAGIVNVVSSFEGQCGRDPWGENKNA